VLALGIALPALRAIANLPRRLSEITTTELCAAAGATIYLVALLCFSLALIQLSSEQPSRSFNEQLFWGGGHVLQFLYCLMMLTGWFVLVRSSLGEEALEADILHLAGPLLTVFALAAPLLYTLLPAFSPLQTEGFRRLQFAVALPTLLVGVGAFTGMLRARRRAALPWRDPAFLAFSLSLVDFGVGGVMGLTITGADTRTPAHYHGVIAGVSLAAMGLLLTHSKSTLAKHFSGRRLACSVILLFGVGQLVACIGLFMAGGYGAPRKAPGGAAGLVDGAVVGLYLNGLGALVAIAGGALFVVTALRVLLGGRDQAQGPLRASLRGSERATP
jgi:heme/copper-type cytochrome/quinol oxidase subunit 1